MAAEWEMGVRTLMRDIDFLKNEVVKLVEPKAVNLTLRSATMKTMAELEAWPGQARGAIETKLKDGPVIV
jgi:hypothetical protein